jgi:hypothetical protein
VIPLFWRSLRMPSRISLPTFLVLFAAVIFLPSPAVRAQAVSAGAGIDPSAGADGLHKVSLLLPSDYPVKLIPADFRPVPLEPGPINATGMAALNQLQASEPAPATPPTPAKPASAGSAMAYRKTRTTMKAHRW